MNEKLILTPFILVILLAFGYTFVNMAIWYVCLLMVEGEIEKKYDGRYGRGIRYRLITSEYEVDLYFEKGSGSYKTAMRSVRALGRSLKGFLVCFLTFPLIYGLIHVIE